MHARTMKLIYSIISLHAQNGLTYNSIIRCALPTLVPIKTLYVNFKSITREHVEFSALERSKASLRMECLEPNAKSKWIIILWATERCSGDFEQFEFHTWLPIPLPPEQTHPPNINVIVLCNWSRSDIRIINLYCLYGIRNNYMLLLLLYWLYNIILWCYLPHETIIYIVSKTYKYHHRQRKCVWWTYIIPDQILNLNSNITQYGLLIFTNEKVY